MTDEQIIKNAERHKLGSCSQCDYKNYGSNCLHELLNDSIKLSNRQRAELSALYKIMNKQDEEISELNRKVASIETLKKMNEQLGDDVDRKYNLICKLEEDLRDSKSEAIKEFAERLKKYSFVDNLSLDGKETVYIQDIDNLVKEMTEENK